MAVYLTAEDRKDAELQWRSLLSHPDGIVQITAKDELAEMIEAGPLPVEV